MIKMREKNLLMALRLMEEFADKTALVSQKSPKRYLWTDAFGVCNYLGFYETLKDSRYLDLAIKLVDQVHETLGKYAEGEHTHKRLSALDEEEAGLHPTINGLRIGKPLPQRRENEPFDEALEWERDGQYFHYLTKWMRALCRVTQLSGDYRYNRWAMELAKTSFNKFSYIDPYSGQRRMYWKMSVDLQRPLVKSMGQHDALDGWIVFMQLQTTAKNDPLKKLNLSFEINELRKMALQSHLLTADPLGLGGLLCDTFFLAKQNMQKDPFFTKILFECIESLRAFKDTQNPICLKAQYRLAFRELGLSLGLKAVQNLQNDVSSAFAAYLPLADEIISFWSKKENRQNQTWIEHEDINTVSLATALAPEGYLG